MTRSASINAISRDDPAFSARALWSGCHGFVQSVFRFISKWVWADFPSERHQDSLDEANRRRGNAS